MKFYRSKTSIWSWKKEPSVRESRKNRTPRATATGVRSERAPSESEALPILDAGAGLHGLELGNDAADAPIGHLIEVHQRGIPDQLRTSQKNQLLRGHIEIETTTESAPWKKPAEMGGGRSPRWCPWRSTARPLPLGHEAEKSRGREKKIRTYPR